MVGVSPDSVARQAKFKEKHNLPFTLIADEDHKIAESYGVWQEKKMFGKKYWGVVRAIFLIDPKGNIARVFPKVKPAKHSQQVLDALAELQAD